MPHRFRNFRVHLMVEHTGYLVNSTSENEAIDQCLYPIGFDQAQFHMWIAGEEVGRTKESEQLPLPLLN